MGILSHVWKPVAVLSISAMTLMGCEKSTPENTNRRPQQTQPQTDVYVNCGGYWRRNTCSVGTRTRIDTPAGRIRINLNF